MNALILAAGLGTRLKPWTLHHPKALVPVAGKPMLARVIESLLSQGFTRLAVNVHHFGDQIVDYLRANDFGVEIAVSDERGLLMDTGGGVLKASRFFTGESFLVHNVDILTDADLRTMGAFADDSYGTALLVSERDTERKLVFDNDMTLKGWHHTGENRFRPDGFAVKSGYREYAFSGIYAVSGSAISEMELKFGHEPFPVMDYFLHPDRHVGVKGILGERFSLVDIGKPKGLEAAERFLGQ